MFACLSVYEQEPESIFQKVIKILTGPKTETETRAACEVPYLHIKTWPDKRGVDWQTVRKCAGRFTERLLLPCGYTVPPEWGLQAFRCERFDREVMKATACVMIDRTRMPMYRRILGLVDERGLYADMLGELLKYYTSVKVLTKAEQPYTLAARDMMERYGAPVLLGESLQSLSECVLILAPDGFGPVNGFRLPCPAIMRDTSFTAPPSGWDIFSHFAVEPPDKVRREVPDGIDPHLFLGALYELGNARPAGLSAGKMRYNNRYATLAEAVEIVSRRAGTYLLL